MPVRSTFRHASSSMCRTRLVEHGVQGRQSPGRRSAPTRAHWLGYQDPLADGERTGHRGRAGPLARLVSPAVSAARSLPAPAVQRNTEGFFIETAQGQGVAPLSSRLLAASMKRAGVLFGVEGDWCASFAFRPAVSLLPAEVLNLDIGSQGIHSAATKLGYRPRDQPCDVPGTWLSGIATYANWRSSAPMPSS